MTDLRKKSSSVLRLLRSNGPENQVSKLWLLRTAGRLDRRFTKSVRYSLRKSGEFIRIEIGTQVFLWPKEAPIGPALRILSELFTPRHPHRYLYGHTEINRDDVVLDIGACEGAFAALVTSQCKQVIAVEPSRSMCALIRELFQVRREECPVVLNCLVGSECGRAYFAEEAENPGASCLVPMGTPGAYELPVMTLDQIVEGLDQKPTFIKCDAEGAEHGIFSGGKRFLREFRPKLAITTYHNDNDYAGMYSLLTSLGYHVAGKGFLFSPSSATLRVQMIHAW